MQKKYKLYGFAPQDRSGRVRWVLEELGLIFESHLLNGKEKEHKSDWFKKINPMGASPAIEIDDQPLFESTAICLALADQHLEKNLAPVPSSSERATYFQWCIFPCATLEPMYAPIWAAEEKDKPAAKVRFLEEAGEIISTLEATLSKQDYLVAGKFTVADILLASALPWAGGPLLDASPILKKYFDRVSARSACERSKIFSKS